MELTEKTVDLDPRAVALLREREFRDTTLFDHLLGIFREETPHLLSSLAEAIRHRDVEVVVRHAHTLKGNAIVLGATCLSELADQIVRSGRSGVISADPSVSDLTEAYDRYLRALGA